MTKYLVLYQSTASPEEQMAQATPEAAAAGMQAWMAWSQRAGAALVDLGNPVSYAMTVGGTEPAPGTPYLGGFSVLEADSREALQALLDGHPHFGAPGASIAVFEFLAIPGM